MTEPIGQQVKGLRDFADPCEGFAAAAEATTRMARIRPAKLGDVAALTRLEWSVFSGDRISRRSWAHLVASQSAAVAVSVPSGGECVQGSVVILMRQGSSVARIYSIAVSPASRGQGIAARLMRHAIEWARAHGSAIMRLETRVDNKEAQSFFARLGFLEFDRRTHYYEDGVEAIRYQKPLWDVGHAGDPLALHSPFYSQT